MEKRLLLLAVLLSLCSCGSEENDPTDDVPPGNGTQEMDTTPPVVSISGIDDEIEVLTSINVSIQDESQTVNTNVQINGEDFFSSNQREFNLEINPFDFPNGDTTLSIISTDGDGNEREFTKTFNLRKLLVRIAASINANPGEAYFSVNSLNGNLLAFAEVTESIENVELYADDDFTPQQIVVTSYILRPNSSRKASLSSIAQIEPGTDLTMFQEAGGVPTEGTFEGNTLTSSFNVQLTEIPTTQLRNSLFAIGNNYFANSRSDFEGPDTSTLTIGVNDETDDVFIYTSDIWAPVSNGPVMVSDYRYLLLDNFTDQTLSFSELNSPTSIQEIRVPGGINTISSRLFGFLDEAAFDANNFTFLFDTSSLNDNGADDSIIEIPVIDEYGIVRQEHTMVMDNGNTYTASLIGLQNVPNVPDWSAARNGSMVSIGGDFDIFTVGFVSDGVANLDWEYTMPDEDSIELPFDDFQFPNEFITFANEQGVDLSSFNSDPFFSITFIDSSEDVNYEDVLFRSQTNIGLGDVLKLRSSF